MSVVQCRPKDLFNHSRSCITPAGLSQQLHLLLPLVSVALRLVHPLQDLQLCAFWQHLLPAQSASDYYLPGSASGSLKMNNEKEILLH